MIESSTTYLYQELTHQIIGAAMTVHRFFGCGFSEHVYQDALELEDIHRSQAINYAKVAGYKLALLINFGEPSLKFE